MRRSERIFLSDTSPQTSPNNTSASAKPVEDKEKSKDKRNDNEKGTAAKGKEGNTHKSKATKKQKSNNLQDISQKLKKKYSTTFNQKSKDKTSELLKVSNNFPIDFLRKMCSQTCTYPIHSHTRKFMFVI